MLMLALSVVYCPKCNMNYEVFKIPIEDDMSYNVRPIYINIYQSAMGYLPFLTFNFLFQGYIPERI